MNVLVTGVAGLLGTELALLLKREGHGVVGVDNCSRYALLGEEGPRMQLDNLVVLASAGVLISTADLRSSPKVGFQILHLPITHIVHAAAQVCHSRKNDTAEDNISNNIEATFRLLEEARIRKLPFLFISSSKIYGERVDHVQPIHGITEQCPLGDQTHLTFFGATKAAADLLAQQYARQYGMVVGCLRPGCFTGLYALAAEAQNWLPWLVHCAKAEKVFRIFGDGEQTRDLLDSEDLARACLLWCEAPKSGVWNIGGGLGRAVTLNAAVATVSKHLGRQVLTSHHPKRAGDIQRLVLDNTKFTRDYGWSPEVSLEDVFTKALGVEPPPSPI